MTARQYYGFRHGGVVYYSTDLRLVQRQAHKLQEVGDLKGKPFIETVDTSLLPVFDRDGYAIVNLDNQVEGEVWEP